MAKHNKNNKAFEKHEADHSTPKRENDNDKKPQLVSENETGENMDASKEYSVSEILSMMNAKTSDVQKTREEISVIDKKINTNSALIEELANKIRPVSRIRSKYKLNGELKERLPMQDRKGIKLEITVLENQNLILEDQKERLNSTLKKRVGEVEDDLKKDRVIQKAKSLKWTKRNKWSVRGKILKTLNSGLKTEKQTLLTLQSYANSKSTSANDNFAKLLSEFLDKIDSETYILCSHELRIEMYEIIKLTLQKWNSKRSHEFTELEIPNK